MWWFGSPGQCRQEAGGYTLRTPRPLLHARKMSSGALWRAVLRCVWARNVLQVEKSPWTITPYNSAVIPSTSHSTYVFTLAPSVRTKAQASRCRMGLREPVLPRSVRPLARQSARSCPGGQSLAALTYTVHRTSGHSRLTLCSDMIGTGRSSASSDPAAAAPSCDGCTVERTLATRGVPADGGQHSVAWLA